MIELFQMGGLLFMSILTIELAAVLYFTFISISTKSFKTSRIKSAGLLAAISGILGQLIGLFDAFQAISIAGTVSPGILAAGLKVSMITTMYGLVIYLIAILISLVLSSKK
ncbi:MotA/TolQ/ExbB proton channel family protein [Ekhidna sp.]